MSKITKPGIALDIDDTLSQTMGYWMKGLKDRFGSPEDLNEEDIVRKYKHTRNIPCWNTPEALAYIRELCNSDALQELLPVVDGAVEAIRAIQALYPIVAYITVRPEHIMNGTKKWLKKNGFPEAPLISRPTSVEHTKGNEWKARVLVERYPEIRGIVDNDETLLDYLPSHYPGLVYLLGHESVTSTLKDHVTPCPDWKSVVAAIKRDHAATTISR